MTRAELKEKAKAQLDGKKKDAAIMLLVVCIITGIINAVLGAIFPGTQTEISSGSGIYMTQAHPVVTILSSIVSIFFTLGMTSYYLKIARGEKPELNEVFSKTSLFPKVLVCSLVGGVLICLGFVALIVPGIILSYCYALVDYVYLDDPELGFVDGLKKSRELMKGHKWEYFVLGLSFLGWMILGVFTLGILYFWLIPYMQVTCANFYESIKGDTTPVAEPIKEEKQEEAEEEKTEE